MSGFSAEGLALREPIDERARAAELILPLRKWRGNAERIRVLDLAAGTGANLRFLAPLLGGGQVWLLADNDPGLLTALPSAMERWASRKGFAIDSGGRRVRGGAFEAEILTLRCDLSRDLGCLPWEDCRLVTASALLDLVSEAWLSNLAEHCRAARAATLFALTYDGRMRWDPEEPADQNVRMMVNSHQFRDKGFGPALGPTAALKAHRTFASSGYRVTSRRSDWRVTPDDEAVQRALIEGWELAAREMVPERGTDLAIWRQTRFAHIAAGRSRLIVGHRDLLAVPI
jgi:SAM-dependent methyltransferase